MNNEELIVKKEKYNVGANPVSAKENRNKINCKRVGGALYATQRGITLIALIITIIILLILAGVTINVLIGENGLFNTAKMAGEEYEKAAIKEEIENAILDIKIEKMQKGEELTIDILEKNLPNKLKDITIEKNEEGQLVGEYKNYEYTITEEYEIIVEKAEVKPVVTYTLSDETIGINELTITLTATVNEGTITKITKPDENYEENVNEVKYKVTQNGKYKFIVEASNGSKRTKTIQIKNLRPIEPIIETSKAYPILTQNGVQGAKIKIIYEDNDNLEHYYSEDNGITWKIYNGEFEPGNSIIIAKSVVKKNPECYTQTQIDNVIPSDALGAQAYDGNIDTSVYLDSPGKTGKYLKIYISSEMQGKKFIITANGRGYSGANYMRFYDNNINELTNIWMGGWDRWSADNTEYEIPIGCTEIRFIGSAEDAKITIYEIQPSIQ